MSARRAPRLVFAVALSLSLWLAACGRKAPAPPDKAPAPKPPAGPAASAPASAPAPKFDAVRQIGQTQLAGASVVARIVRDAAAETVPAAQAPAPVQQARAQAAQSGVVVSDTLTRLERPAADDGKGGAWLGGKVWVTLPRSAEQKAEARPGATGVVYLSELGPFFIPGRLDLAAGTVTFATEHFSYFASATQRAEAELAGFIRAKAQSGADAAQTMVTDKLKNAVDDYLDKMLPDAVKGSVKMKVLKQVWDRREEIAELAKAAGEEDPAAIARGTSLLIGKAIVDNLDEGAFQTVFSGLVDKAGMVEAAPEAFKKARAGDYWAAVEVMGRAYSTETPIYKAVTGAAEQVQKRIDDWKQHEWETAFAAYTRGAPGSFMGIRRPVDAGDWEQLVTSYGGIVDYVQKKYGISDPEKASAHARKLFDARKSQEEAARKEEARLRRWLDAFNGARWSGKSDFIRTAGLEGKSQKEQFEAFLKRVNTVERDMASLGIAGGAMYWTNIEKGQWGINAQARELLTAFATGGAKAYREKLAALRKDLAKPLKALPPPPAKPSAPAASAPRTQGPARYMVTFTGGWKGQFEMRLYTATGKFNGRHDQKIAIKQTSETAKEESTTANVVWRGDYSRVTKTVTGEIAGSYMYGQIEGFNGMEDQTHPVKGKFTGKFQATNPPTFDGAWSAEAGGAAYSGTWKAQLIRDK